MNKLILNLSMIGVSLLVLGTLNSIFLKGESQEAENNASFLTYNDTAYGINIQYPSDWNIDQSVHQFLITFLQNLSSSESHGGIDQQNDVVKTKISELLDTFGLESVSDVFGLSPDRKAEFLQFASKVLNEGSVQAIVAFRSPDHEGNLNIVAENISSVSPISLNDYVSASIGGLKILTPDLTIEQQPMEITVDGKPVMTFVYSAKNPLDKSLTAKFLVAATIKGDTAHILTFRSTPDGYPKYESTYNQMLQSFKVTN